MSASRPNSPFAAGSKHPRIFLSHASADTKRVHELYERLRSVGTPWAASFDLRPGDEWGPKTNEAILSADVAIICLSRNTTSRSGYLEKETSTILSEQGRRSLNFILPVRLEDADVPKVLEK